MDPVVDTRCSDGPPEAGSLHALTVRGTLAHLLEDGRLECVACAHRCRLPEGAVGVCGVRARAGADLRVPHGWVAARRVRAVETNTIYHLRPGASALIFGMVGCDLRCPYCHNWKLSQALRDTAAPPPVAERISAAALADAAVAAGCRVVAAAYNEPMITAEWAHDVFAVARARGLATALVSDGHTTPEALAYLRGVTDVFRVDLKAATEEGYRALGGRLAPVLAAIVEARRLGYWVEAVTLVVPGFNDDVAAIRTLADRLAAIDPALPWHLNAFQPRYRMRDVPAPAASSLVSLAGIAYARGLRYVYVGNAGGTQLEHTRCATCHLPVIERRDWATTRITLTPDGRCPGCATAIPGRFD